VDQCKKHADVWAITPAFNLGHRRALVFGSHPYFDLCSSPTLVSLGMTVTAAPFPRVRRYEGGSRMNLLRLSMHGVRMLMPFMERVAARTLTAFSG
jgi:hypothetical protein